MPFPPHHRPPLTEQQRRQVEDVADVAPTVAHKWAWLAWWGYSFDDLCQEAHLAICRAVGQFPGGDWPSYAFGAARNRMRDLAKLAKGKGRADAICVSLDEDTTLAVPLASEAAPCPDREEYYALLPRRQAEVLRLHLEGASNREIAEQLGITEAAVRIHRKRAVAKLTEHYAQEP